VFIDIAAESPNEQIVLLEVKQIEISPVHRFMELVGQYLVYRSVLDMVGYEYKLYVAMTDSDYHAIVKHPLGQHVLREKLVDPIPFVTFDPVMEVILRWIPQP